jgi:GT2 family glycosyltransferase
MLISFVISTYNRREVLMRTLENVGQCGLAKNLFEILVVDNNSPDATASMLMQDYPDVELLRLDRNYGSCAKNFAIAEARGRYVVFLDDDSYPMPGAIARMIEHFEADKTLGAAIFTITLPDGSRECSAYPDVFIGCGTGFRREALLQVGGLPKDFFMQAEEYDLSLRLMQAGWNLRTFDDLHVTHLKTPNARRSWRTMRLDVRNNFILALRYLPKQWRMRFAWDWMRRYYHIAAMKGQRSAFLIGLMQGARRCVESSKRQTIGEIVFERFTRMQEIEQQMTKIAGQSATQTVLLIDYGKNILPYYLAAMKCGLNIVAIADNRLAGGTYRGIPIVNDSIARRLQFDAAIISNLSPVHAAERLKTWRTIDQRRIFDLFEMQTESAHQAMAA